jgi:hypothetical protein
MNEKPERRAARAGARRMDRHRFLQIARVAGVAVSTPGPLEARQA